MNQKRPLSTLKKLENNPRYIMDASFEKLMTSIKDNPEYFEARPLILSDRTGDLVIIAGNQRYEAAKKLGLIHVPTFLISGLTEEKEREIIIRDNVSNGSWDHDILSAEWDLEQLKDWDLFIDIDVPEDVVDEPEPEKSLSKKLIIECGELNKLEELYEEMQNRGFVVSLK